MQSIRRMPFARSRWPSAFVGVSLAFICCFALVDKNSSVASQGSSVDDLFGRCVAHIEDACVKEDVLYLSLGQNHGIVTRNAKRKRNTVFRRGGSNTPFGDSISNLLHWRGPFGEFVVLERANFTTLRRHLPTVRGRTLYRYYKTTSGEMELMTLHWILHQLLNRLSTLHTRCGIRHGSSSSLRLSILIRL